MDAVIGHPALSGWLVIDRALEWARPDLEVPDLALRSCLAEIREHDEGGGVYFGLGWSELLRPEMAQTLAQQVEGLRMSGLEDGLEHVGLLDNRMEPKDYVETWFRELLFSQPGERIEDFIDISLNQYLTDPNMHLPRLWEHFKEACGYRHGMGS